MQRSNPSVLNFPLIFTWKEMQLEKTVRAQVLISVSKKKFKRAVDRNHIKRLIRESYRLNKHSLYEKLGDRQLLLHINYIAPQIIDFFSLQQSIIKGMEKMLREINKS